jgi:hypothetical protein
MRNMPNGVIIDTITPAIALPLMRFITAKTIVKVIATSTMMGKIFASIFIILIISATRLV